MDSDDLIGVDTGNDMVDDDERDEQEFERLALNSNFDPALLLGCWGEEDDDEEDDTGERDADCVTAAVTTSTVTTSTATTARGTSTTNSYNSGSSHNNKRGEYHNNYHHHNISEPNSTGQSGSHLYDQPDETQDAAWDEFDKAQRTRMIATAAAAHTSSKLDRGALTPANAVAPSAITNSTRTDQTNNNKRTPSAIDILSGGRVAAFPPFEVTATGTNSSEQKQPTPFHAPFPHLFAGLGTPSNTSGALSSFLPTVQNPMPGNTSGTTSIDSSVLLPLAFNALAAGVDLSSFFCMPQLNTSATGTSLSGSPPEGVPTGTAMESVLAAAAIPNPVLPLASATSEAAAVGDDKKAPAIGPNTNNQESQQQQMSSSNNPINGTTFNNTKKRGTSVRRSKNSTNGGPQPRQPKNGRKTKNKSNNNVDEEPPFMLFDAPVELRHNFIQSQRAHGLPVLHDNNSYHFARSSAAVAAPSTNMGELSTDGGGGGGLLPTFLARPVPPNGPMPRLVDARHGDDTAGSKRLKNAKEQKRAQRITELIEQLRIRMEKGGWKVGIKSKLHTLSSCSDYVKHLVQTTKEKESAVEQARRDLEAKRRKLEEEKSSAQQDPSEPESTTSSLTMSSGSRSFHHHHHHHGNSNGKEQSQQEEQQQQSSHQDPSNPPQNGTGGACSTDESGRSSQNENNNNSNTKRNHSSTSQEETNNSEDYTSSIDQDYRGGKKRRLNGSGAQGFEGYKSSVSDITDNNKYAKGSSTGSDEATMTAAPSTAMAGDGESEKADSPAGPSTQNTVCSDAAVAASSDTKGPTSYDSSTGQGEGEYTSGMAIQTITTTITSSGSGSGDRKRKPSNYEGDSRSGGGGGDGASLRGAVSGEKHKKAKSSSLSAGRDAKSFEHNFQLDYQEVFIKSNVPQIIATTTGRILAHNDMFLRVTRLRRSHVDRMTIFSLVQPAMLSNLFGLVASSLREDDDQREQMLEHQEQRSRIEAEAEEDKKTRAKKTSTPLQDYSTMTLPCVTFADRPTLFMTITLMGDEDVKKRCFHCVFTDQPPGAAEGSVGSVTPQLLEKLFQAKPLHSGGRCGGCSGTSGRAASVGSDNVCGSRESHTASSNNTRKNDNGTDTKISNNVLLSSEKSSTERNETSIQSAMDTENAVVTDDAR